jgi:hypothetical protein
MPGEVTKVRCVGVQIAEARLMDQEAQKSIVTSPMTFEVKEESTIASWVRVRCRNAESRQKLWQDDPSDEIVLFFWIWFRIFRVLDVCVFDAIKRWMR